MNFIFHFLQRRKKGVTLLVGGGGGSNLMSQWRYFGKNSLETPRKQSSKTWHLPAPVHRRPLRITRRWDVNETWPSTRIATDSARWRIQEVCCDQHAKGTIPLQQAAVWGGISPCDLSANDWRYPTRHSARLCVHWWHTGNGQIRGTASADCERSSVETRSCGPQTGKRAESFTQEQETGFVERDSSTHWNTPDHSLAMKANLSISWSNLRTLRRCIGQNIHCQDTWEHHCFISRVVESVPCLPGKWVKPADTGKGSDWGQHYCWDSTFHLSSRWGGGMR